MWWRRLQFAEGVAVPELEAGCVTVWGAALREAPQSSSGILTDAEQVRASGLKLARMRTQFIAARCTLRTLLAGYLRIPPREVPILYQDGGKPYLSAPFSAWQFNVSHSNNRGLFAFTHVGRVGVDLERVRVVENLGGLVDRFFAPREREWFHALPPDEQTACFFRTWTCKEALLKAMGRGVQSLDCCEIACLPGEPARLVQLREQPGEEGTWRLHEWEPEPGFRAALALEGLTPQ